ncbi:MAG: hypothetical protein JO007_19525 [Alphaproteobacteria bacterium]|nr:hypothetical protein [Alphaproteobacteria bacterium]
MYFRRALSAAEAFSAVFAAAVEPPGATLTPSITPIEVVIALDIQFWCVNA